MVATTGQAAGQPQAQPAPQAGGAQDEAARKGAARAKLMEGDALLKQGAYQDALAVFEEAYALYPSPKIHYDFGLAYQGMGRGADALEAFEVFLREVNDAQPEVRAKAVAARDDLLARVGVVRVTADVNGASILIDGREVGRTPYGRDIRLDPGPHMLTVDRGGGLVPFTQRLAVRAATVVVVDARFADGAGALHGPPSLASTSSATGDSSRDPTSASAVAGDGAPDGRAPPGWLRPAAWTAAGIGLAALTVGAISWAVKESKFKSFNNSAACDRALPNDGGTTCHDLVGSGETAKGIAIGAFISAGVFGLASTAAFLLTSRHGGDGEGGTGLSFSCGPTLDQALDHSWGGSCTGRF